MKKINFLLVFGLIMLIANSAFARFCSECGVEINDNSKFCNACGTKINNTDVNREKLEDKLEKLLQPITEFGNIVVSGHKNHSYNDEYEHYKRQYEINKPELEKLMSSKEISYHNKKLIQLNQLKWKNLTDFIGWYNKKQREYYSDGLLKFYSNYTYKINQVISMANQNEKKEILEQKELELANYQLFKVNAKFVKLDSGIGIKHDGYVGVLEVTENEVKCVHVGDTNEIYIKTFGQWIIDPISNQCMKKANDGKIAKSSFIKRTTCEKIY